MSVPALLERLEGVLTAVSLNEQAVQASLEAYRRSFEAYGIGVAAEGRLIVDMAERLERLERMVGDLRNQVRSALDTRVRDAPRTD